MLQRNSTRTSTASNNRVNKIIVKLFERLLQVIKSKIVPGFSYDLSRSDSSAFPSDFSRSFIKRRLLTNTLALSSDIIEQRMLLNINCCMVRDEDGTETDMDIICRFPPLLVRSGGLTKVGLAVRVILAHLTEGQECKIWGFRE